MIPLRLAEVAGAVGGELRGVDGDQVVTGHVRSDTRAIEPGDLFVAIRGEHVDGHAFAQDAIDRGAVAVLASRTLAGLACVVAPEPPAGLDVEASVAAMGKLARLVVDRLEQTRVVGVTGSQGKTGTKDLLAEVLSAAGATIAPVASLNNELGVPATALQADQNTRYLVLEMGARGLGHIRYLTTLAPPRIGVVLNVGVAHLGEFGSRERIAVAKAELVEALPDDGVAVLNADDPLVAGMAERTRARVVRVGTSAHVDVRAEEVTLDDRARPCFRLVTPEGSAIVRLSLVGAHQVSNALAAAAVGRAVGLDVATVADALTQARRQARWRMEVTDREDGVTVVNDAYNANPDSIRAALQTLVVLAGGSQPEQRRRTWAVLGEVLELGAASRSEHEEIGRLAVRLGVSKIVAVGEGARPIDDGASAQAREQRSGEETMVVSDVDEAKALLHRELRPGDVVLVKSSRDAGLRYLGEALTATSTTSEAGA